MQAHTAQADIRNLLNQMVAISTNPTTAQRISDQIEVLTMAFTASSPDDIWVNQYDLTESEARICRLLSTKMGQTVTRDALMNAIYFDRNGEEPNIKIVDIFICKLRKKLAARNCPLMIDNTWGKGYRLLHRAAYAKAA